MITITEQDYKNIRKKNKLPKRLLDQNINVVMPQNAAVKWLTDLRSGQYTQTDGILYNVETEGYCCLGLQQMGAIGKIELADVFDHQGNGEYRTIAALTEGGTDVPIRAAGIPSIQYLRSQGIFYADENGYESEIPYLYVNGNYQSVALLNDDGHSFAQIADYLEAYMAVY